MKAVCIGIAFVVALSIAQADGLRAHVEASTKAIASAMKKKDFASLEKQMRAGSTADFKYTEQGKTEGLDAMLTQMKAGLGMMNSFSVCKLEILSLKQNGNSAVGMLRHTLTGTMKGADKKTHTMTFTGVSQNTYKNVGGQWKMSSMTWKSQNESMDGKPFHG